MQATTYLGYARGGHEFAVADDLRDLGIPTWCGRVIEWKRTGHKRHPEPHERPALPNYLFMDLRPSQFYTAQRVKHLANTMHPLTPFAERDYRRFQRSVDSHYAAALRDVENATEPRPEFTQGQVIKAITGPLAETMATFERIVKAGDRWQYEATTELMGRTVRVRFDPADVRKAV